MASRVKPNLAIFDRRTSLVLMGLVVSMSMVSGLLLWMEPTPMGPLSVPHLKAERATTVGIEAVFATQAPLSDAWGRVIIDHSGTTSGDLQTLGEAYHFLIGNGSGAGDGEIQIGDRWMNQIQASQALSPTGDRSAELGQAISICLVGDGNRNAPTSLQIQQLVRLVTAIQREIKIPRDAVMLRSSVSDSTSPGQLFPTSLLLRQLIDLDVR